VQIFDSSPEIEKERRSNILGLAYGRFSTLAMAYLLNTSSIRAFYIYGLCLLVEMITSVMFLLFTKEIVCL